MRKILFLGLLALLGFSTAANAQFVLTPDGVRNEANAADIHYALNIADRGADDIMDEVLRYMAASAPWNYSVNHLRDGFISVNGEALSAITTHVRPSWNIRFRLNVEFADGVLRTSVVVLWPLVCSVVDDGETRSPYFLNAGSGAINSVYNRKGVPNKVLKSSIEEFFNGFVNGLYAHLEKHAAQR